jgi:hypothetical protein
VFAAIACRARDVVRPVVVLVAIGMLVGTPARALEVECSPPRLQGGWLWVELHLTDLFPARVEESLGRGMPARLQIHAELWRRRTGWFDRMTSAFDAAIKIRHDVWTRRYRMERPGVQPITASTLDSLGLVLSRPLSLPVAHAAGLPPDARYYVVVSVTLKPLSVEDVEEGEDWLSGEVVTKRRAGVGIITALPRSLFDAVRNFAGLGDQRVRAISEDFRLDELAQAP